MAILPESATFLDQQGLAKWLPWKRTSEAVVGTVGNSGSTDNNNVDAKRASSSNGYWWHLCRYHEELLHAWNPIKSKWRSTRKLPVLEWYQVHESSRDPGILHGYRPEECTWTDCWNFLFVASNETFNVWSHIVATVYFVWRTVQLAEQWGYVGDRDAFQQPADPYYRVFLVYMVTACLYPLMSAVAHAFSPMSHRARAVCFFMDYAAICNYSFGCALLYRAYVLTDDWMGPVWTDAFLGVACFLSLASTLLTCCSRALVTDVVAQRIMRLAAFTLPYVWVTIPLVGRLSGCWFGLESADEHSACLTDETYQSARLHTAQMAVAFLASFTYASHLPERIFPGTFDYFGHSHNLLHVCGVAATYFQLEGSLVDLSVRRHHLISANLALVDYCWTVVVPIGVFVGHAAILIVFTRYMFTHPDPVSDDRDKHCGKCH